jgi:monoterpene epsilon-lactone hydrolase
MGVVSKEFQNVVSILKQFQAPGKEPNVEDERTSLEQMAKLVTVPKDVKCESVDAGGVRGEWITAPGSAIDHIVLYLHGGGYVAGSIKTHKELASRISRASGARVLVIDYRLAPEAPFPAALEDAVATYRWLISSARIEPKNIVVAGDSAGGGLTIATLVRLRNAGVTLPAAAVCLSPWTDLANTGDSFKKNAKIDPFVTPEGCKFDESQYLGGENPRNPLVSPVYADLHGLPPMLIQVGTSEILLDDSVRLADHAKRAGVDVKLDIWKEMIHVFQAFAVFLPEGRQAINEIGKFVRKFLK